MTIRVEMHGEFPSYVEKCFGTTAEILAHVPTVRMAEGFSTNGGGQGTWVAGNGTWVGFTNAPGSPSAPFATRAALEAATSPFATGDKAWYLDPASPTGRYEAMWEGAAWGSGYLPNLSTAPGSPAAPFASTAERNAAGPFRSNTVAWIAGDPVPTAYMLVNGATGVSDTDWQEMAGGSAAIAYGDLT